MSTSGNVGSVTQLPVWYTDEQLEARASISGNWFTVPPVNINANGRAFNRAAHGIHKRTIQNVSTTPLFYWLKETAPDYVSEAPHGIIAGCQVARDGTGGQVDLSSYNGSVWIGNPAGSVDALVFASYIPGISGANVQLI